MVQTLNYQSQPIDRVIELISPILRGWVNYIGVRHSSECFSFIKVWVEKKSGGILDDPGIVEASAGNTGQIPNSRWINHENENLLHGYIQSTG
jgi:Group II intron, maturase-specific domain